MGNKKSRNRVVYSTNPDFEVDNNENEMETLNAAEQQLSVSIDKKNRGGKSATLIKGFIGSTEDITSLGKELKAACGVGGSVKDGEIIIQGEKRDKVMEILKKKGYQVKRVGG